MNTIYYNEMKQQDGVIIYACGNESDIKNNIGIVLNDIGRERLELMKAQGKPFFGFKSYKNLVVSLSNNPPYGYIIGFYEFSDINSALDFYNFQKDKGWLESDRESFINKAMEALNYTGDNAIIKHNPFLV